jgi:hypothetical protein
VAIPAWRLHCTRGKSQNIGCRGFTALVGSEFLKNVVRLVILIDVSVFLSFFSEHTDEKNDMMGMHPRTVSQGFYWIFSVSKGPELMPLGRTPIPMNPGLLSPGLQYDP